MFILQVIISFFVGGVLIALQTLLAERVPFRWRGPILTMPSTMALGFFFIGLTKTPFDVRQAAFFFPAALASSYMFVLIYALLSQKNLLVNLFCSYTTWCIVAFIILKYPPQNLTSSIFLYGLPIAILAYLIVGRLPQITNIIPVPINWRHILIRSLIGGSVVSMIVILSKTLGNIWGSLFSAFPAAFTSTFLIYSFVHGKKVIPSIAKSLFFPGSIVFVIYACIAGLTFPKFGIWLGTLFSYLGVGIFYFIYNLINKKTV